VLGASADEARAVPDEAGWSSDDAVDVVVAADWDEGMGASLRCGLGALRDGAADAALVTLVDLPDVHEPVLRRVLDAGSGPGALVRATYDGAPGHPVLIGRDHWEGVAATAQGDRGARTYFRTHEPVACECGDLATGRDLDRPEDQE
jgi:CTP:molybdopterin cytidylyltransferase MocA